MKTRYYQYAVIAIAAMLLMACNGIETVGLDADSVISKHKTSLIRDVNVTQNEAIGIANMFAHSNAGSDNPQTKGAFSSTKMISSSETIREDGQNLMYVFNYEGGGFVIVGSTRNYYPILAYSDEGSFILQDDMGPVDVWLDETKVSIKNSSSLDNATKTQMQNLWSRYDGTYVDPAQALLSSRRPQTRSTGEEACWDHIEELYAADSSGEWTFLPLSFVEDIFDDAGLSSYYATICYSATQNNSALNETVIGFKSGPIYNQVGPLLSTYGWHQFTPFNNQCNGYAAGSGAIAMAQVMKHYGYPGIINWNGNIITMSAIPNYADASSPQPYLIAYIGDSVNMTYGTSFSWCTPASIVSELNLIGYTATKSSHSATTVKNQIVYGSKPVIMVGNALNAPLPTPSLYTTQSHYWVCDGVEEDIYNQITFFTENQPGGTGNFTQGMYSINNPGIIGGTYYYYYHMNWGKNDNSDGWYADNNLPTSNNYQYYREDIYVTSPI